MKIQINYIPSGMYDEFLRLGEMDVEEILAGLEKPRRKQRITNPFSGESTMVEPDASALYDYVKGLERLISSIEENHPFTESLSRCHARVLSYFMNRWPKEYMILLD